MHPHAACQNVAFLSQATFCLTARRKQQVLVETLMETHTLIQQSGTRRNNPGAEKTYVATGEDATGVVRVRSGAERGMKGPDQS